MANRWWIYQQERFPLLKHGLLVTVLSFAAVSYSLLLRDRLGTQALWQSPTSLLIAWVSVFLLWVQLRVANELKDYREDCRYKPHRPVPRGLVALWELGGVAIVAAAIQLGLAIYMGWPLVGVLVGVWAYMGLMSQQFFVGRWLKTQPVIYLLSSALILPLIAFYATACDWLAAGAALPLDLWRFGLVSWGAGIVLEIGRKIRIPKDEEAGVNTYSSLWGHQRAGTVWLVTVLGLMAAAIMAAMPVNFVMPMALAALLLLTFSILKTWQFIYRPGSHKAAEFELLSGLWTVAVYLAIAIVPLVLRELPGLLQ
jgi:4-hydroxybenzoate polyprenyltransferase